MKIYVDYNINNINSKLNQYMVSKDTQVHIYHENGIVQLVNNRFVKLTYNDKTIITKNIEGIKYLIDPSSYKLGNEVMQIPTNHIIEKYIMHVYKLRKNSLVDLVIIFDNNVVVDWYFRTKEDFLNIKEDIDTFLSYIK